MLGKAKHLLSSSSEHRAAPESNALLSSDSASRATTLIQKGRDDDGVLHFASAPFAGPIRSLGIGIGEDAERDRSARRGKGLLLP
jgi:hypothetical protein